LTGEVDKTRLKGDNHSVEGRRNCPVQAADNATNPKPSMPIDPANTIVYRRARFATRLPLDRRYTASHSWLLELSPGHWRIGLTKFATRMLGDLVEHDFSVAVDEPLALGQAIGHVEGFKAVSDVFSVATGRFAGGNPALNDDPMLVDSDPYDRGWLYEIQGEPDPGLLDAAGYVRLLDTIIDRLLATSDYTEGDDSCPTQDIS
jgi:glycine cleavage system H protein